jgi:site-specific recombinase XerD
MNEIAVPDGSGWTEADLTISEVTAARLEAAKSQHTQEAYERNWSRFAAWCDACGRSALPATPHTLLEYVQELTSRTPPPAPATVYQIIATVRTVHRDAGFPGQPDTRATLQLVRGYRRERADAGFRVRRAAPISVKELQELAATCDQRTLAGTRDRALLLLGYALLARASELAGLVLTDIHNAGAYGLMVYIRSSKTDQEARGVEINVPYGRYESTCAVRATRAWMVALSEHGITEGPLFRRVDRRDRIGGTPGAAGVGDGGALHRGSITRIVRRQARLAGLEEPQFISGHSLRAGSATELDRAGAPISAIAEQGRWSKNSNALSGYLRVGSMTRNNPLKNLDL